MCTKGAILAALTCLFLGTAGGCGSNRDAGNTEQTDNPAQALTKWFRSVEGEVTKMEEKQREFTRFHVVARPPAKGDLVKLSAAGVKVGEEADASATQLSRITALTKEEAEGLYCYFFAFYVNLEFSPGRQEFEEVIANLVKARLQGSASPEQTHESADALRQSMIRAEKAGGPAPEVAAAMLC